jgi:hypothetical protein
LIIESWGEQISVSDYPAESVAHFPMIVGSCMCIQSGADCDDWDGDGHDDDSNGDGVSHGDYSTRST